MLSITRTCYGGELQTAMLQGIPYVYETNSTINEALNIHPGVSPSSGVYAHMKYFVIGVGGHSVGAAASGRAKIVEEEFEPTSAALYAIRPFVLRLESNDLTAEQRLKFGLRRKEQHGGKNYFAYYGKVIDQTNTTTKKMLYKKRNGVETFTPFSPTNDNINPTPPIILPNQVVPTLSEADKIIVSSLTTIPFTEWDVNEYVNAIRIIDGDEDLAVISEVGLVAAFPRTVTAEGAGGASFQFTEMMGSLLIQYITLFIDFNSANMGTQFSIDAGVAEPLVTKSN